MFRNPACEFVYVRSYSRWLPDKKRRETWPETVKRYIRFIEKERGALIPAKVLRKSEEYILSMSVMPSMRALWTAGGPAAADNTCMYNCSFQAVESIEAFAESLYILMCGAGYGFSVENKYIEKLPMIPSLSHDRADTCLISDDKMGWANSVRLLITSLYNGTDTKMDYSLIRPYGAKLKTMGGKASGPAPLLTLHNFIRDVFEKAQGRKLTSLEAHDILNQVAEVVVVGGVRRSSEISLSDLDDELMRDAKKIPYPMRRAMANNSAVYHDKPTAVEFLKEWSTIAASGTGERGIFNLGSAIKTAPKRRDASQIAGANPCCEITLRNKQFCNLSEVVIREDDDLDDLLDKVECATWIGVIQSTFTKFPYLSEGWKENCEEERLLGVSLTGQMDNIKILNKESLQALKSRALKVSRKASRILGINVAAAVTCVKPSGTVSQLVDSASGIHTRYSPYYIRRYRLSSNDSLCSFLKDQGVMLSPENGERKKDWNRAKKLFESGNPEFSSNGKEGYRDACRIFRKTEEWLPDFVNTWVVSFCIKSPKNAVFRENMTALQQLEHYKLIQKYWCEHNASCTVYVQDHEWFEVGNWVYKNWDYINGVSFLPYDGGKYEQLPYEEITEEQYIKFSSKFPELDYSNLSDYEQDDVTDGSKTWACAGDKCDM